MNTILAVILVFAIPMGIMVIIGVILEHFFGETLEEYHQRHEARRIALENLHDIVEL